MSKFINVSNEDILYQIKISGQFPGLVEAITSRKIITDTAQKVGIKLELEELQQAADSLRLAHKLLKAEDTWAWLEKHHLSVDDFEAMAHTNLLTHKLATHLFRERVEPFFYEHQLDYAGAVTYEVILDDEDLALELFCALKEGEMSFYEIARQYIEEPELRRAGGYRGIQRRRDFRPEIAAVVFAATPPQLLKPIITPKGVHLILVEEIIEAQLNEQLRVKILGDLFATWLKQKIAELEILTQLNSDANSETEVAKAKSATAV